MTDKNIAKNLEYDGKLESVEGFHDVYYFVAKNEKSAEKIFYELYNENIAEYALVNDYIDPEFSEFGELKCGLELYIDPKGESVDKAILNLVIVDYDEDNEEDIEEIEISEINISDNLSALLVEKAEEAIAETFKNFS